LLSLIGNRFFMRFSFFIFLVLLSSCKTETNVKVDVKKTLPLSGDWRMEFDLGQDQLPINFILNHKSENELEFVFTNGDEEILVDDILVFGDSLVIQMPIFSSKFYLKKESEEKLMGYFIDGSRPDPYRVDVTAEHGVENRFAGKNMLNLSQLKNKWDITFSPNNTDDLWKAIGVFEQKKDGEVNGTFLTETGDFRFLEGNVSGNVLRLSCFDGAHLFLFTATMNNDSLVDGTFYSGKHHKEGWIGNVNNDVQLRDPNSITKVVGDKDWRNVVVKDMNNESVRLGNVASPDRVKIIQILGSWCPNCMDETAYYRGLYKSNKDDVQIIPVGFEKDGEGIESLIKLKMDMKLPYAMFLGGDRNKKVANEVFPMLNQVVSFPTSIIIDKEDNIRKVHTGFYGPGTGSYYDEYVVEMDAFINALINEDL